MNMEKNREMNIETTEAKEELIRIRNQVLIAEEQRLNGAQTIPVSEARELLKKV